MSKFYLSSALLMFLCLPFGYVQAQVLPAARAVNWRLAGYRSTIPVYTFNYNMQFAGLVGDGQTPNDAAFNAVLTNLNGSSAIIEFPAGDFLFNNPVDIPDNILIKGAGADSTSLSFNLGGTRNAVQISGTISPADTSSFVLAANKGAQTIDVLDATRFVVGDYLHIIQNDSDLMFSTWAYGTYGQIVKIAAINANQISLHSPLRLDYDLNRNPFIRKIIPAQNVGIECIKIKRLDASAGQTTNIAFLYAANCWLKGVESELTNFAHVGISRSTNIVVQNSYFHNAHAFGGNGQGYGIVMQETSNECLLESNHFRRLRHAILLQSGANGNVTAYNYSRDAYWSSFPNNSAGDIALHGNMPYANLFESNVFCNIVIDNSHGANGDYNTFLRNRAYLYGIFFSAANSPNQNFIGNEVSNPAFPFGLYNLQGTGHFEFGNNIKGTTTPAGTDNLTDSSYYYDSRPDFVYTNSFAAIGLPNDINTGTIPAKERWDFAEIIKNECSDPSTPQFSIQTPQITVNEDVDSVVIFINVRNPNTLSNSVSLTVQDLYSTAQDATDYQIIPFGQMSINIAPMDNFRQRAVVYINDDAAVEPTETLQLVLSTNNSPATIADSIVTISIIDNDVSAVSSATSPQLLLYPNPTAEGLFIQSSKSIIRVEIYNSLGQLILQQAPSQTIDTQNGSYSYPVSTQQLPIGIYHAKIYHNSGFETRSFIKE